MLPVLSWPGATPFTGPFRGSNSQLTLSSQVLYWVLRGEAQFRFPQRQWVACVGQALWVPSGGEARVRLSDEAVVVPVPGLALAGHARPCVIDVDQTLRPWLMAAFGTALGYMDQPQILPALNAQMEPLTQSQGLMPLMPSSPEALGLARRVLQQPSYFESLAVEAARCQWSPRTLQRRFETETGLGPADWVRSARLAIAAEYLSAGQDQLWVAQHVGYETLSGFGRAFRAYTGTTPGRWHNKSPAQNSLVAAQTLPFLPAQRTWNRVNGAHVAVWLMRGEALVRVGHRTYHLRAGQAMLLPAGVPNQAKIGPDGLLLPLGYRSGSDDLPPLPVSPTTLSVSEEELIAISVTAYAGEVSKQTGSVGFDLVLANATGQSRSDLTLARLASTIATHSPQTLSLAQWAKRINAQELMVRKTVQEQTGLTFAQWVRLTKMTGARYLLQRGQTPQHVARQLGYANPSAFSRAFRATHGASPTQLTP